MTPTHLAGPGSGSAGSHGIRGRTRHAGGGTCTATIESESELLSNLDALSLINCLCTPEKDLLLQQRIRNSGGTDNFTRALGLVGLELCLDPTALPLLDTLLLQKAERRASVNLRPISL
jgi:hypothetical protein